eukprot:CAMPEP_0195299306 /NCGR_PEP_ID=MMETSP0707-20130614/25300_1 /TAXON_ID=33640 /ORGANISM="Asterionellopsis glacialis, Strain CCMP134" /LENGTH=357 /DNA_ID=CAMNT_0040361675 /DNA_START=146 /DNA_END=1219 /DNA_ORIENTATION=+
MPPSTTGIKRSRDAAYTEKSASGGGFFGGLFASCKATGVGTGFCAPNKHVNSHDADVLGYLQGEFDRLSPEEQDQVHRDLYGIDEKSPEMDDPVVVQELIQDLEAAILNIPEKKKGAYLEALQRCPEFFTRQNLLQFLRADRYEPKKAARRITQHWEVRLELWGSHRAFKPKITMEDLGEGDLLALRCGGIRKLQGRDRAGRAIFWNRGMDYEFHEMNDLVRALWYQISLSAEDEETQENGIVAILYGLGSYSLRRWDNSNTRDLLKVLDKVMPVRTVGFHHLFNDLKLRSLVPVLLALAGKRLRARYRMHTGSVQECIFELMYFGIASEILPVDHEGTTLIDSHLSWIEELRQQGR